MPIAIKVFDGGDGKFNGDYCFYGLGKGVFNKATIPISIHTLNKFTITLKLVPLKGNELVN